MIYFYCVKSVRIRSFAGPYFPVFGLNTERYSVRMRENTDQKNSEYGHFSQILEEDILNYKNYIILKKNENF